MSRFPIGFGELMLILLFVFLASAAFALWQHSLPAGMFLFAIILIAMLILALDNK